MTSENRNSREREPMNVQPMACCDWKMVVVTTLRCGGLVLAECCNCAAIWNMTEEEFYLRVEREDIAKRLDVAEGKVGDAVEQLDALLKQAGTHPYYRADLERATKAEKRVGELEGALRSLAQTGACACAMGGNPRCGACVGCLAVMALRAA